MELTLRSVGLRECEILRMLMDAGLLTESQIRLSAQKLYRASTHCAWLSDLRSVVSYTHGETPELWPIHAVRATLRGDLNS
jgi:hypothetical protein